MFCGPFKLRPIRGFACGLWDCCYQTTWALQVNVGGLSGDGDPPLQAADRARGRGHLSCRREQSFSRQPLFRAMNLVLGTGSSASSIIFNTTLVRPLRASTTQPEIVQSKTNVAECIGWPSQSPPSHPVEPFSHSVIIYCLS